MADEEKEVLEEEAEGGEKKSSPIVKILIIAIVAVLLIGGTILVSYKVANNVDESVAKKGMETSSAHEEQYIKPPYSTWVMNGEKDDPTIFNIQPAKGSRRSPTLMVVVAFGYDPDESSEAAAELEKRKAQIQDLFITTVGKMTVKDLSIDHVNSFKEELLKIINGVLSKKARVDKVYFQKYFIQQ